MTQYYYEILMNSYRLGNMEKFRSDLKEYLIADVLDNADKEKLISIDPVVVLEIMEDLSPEVIKTLMDGFALKSLQEFKDRFENLFREQPSIANKFIKIAKDSVREDDD